MADAIYSREFYVAGVQYHELKNIINDLKEGSALNLVPEPTNSYDPNAVKITYKQDKDEEVMIGYVPKRFSSEVAAALTISDKATCVISNLTPSAKPWEQCKVKVELT